MARKVKINGLRELEDALAQLSKATARNTLHRVLRRAGEPIRAMAERLAPDDPETGGTDLKRSIAVSTKIKGKKKEQKSFAEVYVGPERGRNSSVGSKQEFGTVNHAAQPFMRPAWDAQQDAALKIISDDLGMEIAKSAERAAARAAKKARG